MMFVMKKSVYSSEYQVVLETLVGLRKAAGLTQRELAAKLHREHSFVWRIETGERRLDVVEFAWVCQALGRDAATIYAGMATRWSYPAARSTLHLAAEAPDSKGYFAKKA